MEDWRLQGQEKYLLGKSLVKKHYVKNSGAWEHEHCAFCWDKISESGNSIAYATLDLKHWICTECYKDFCERFNWSVAEDM